MQKKNIIILILVLVILSITGYVIFNKVFNKKIDNNDDQTELENIPIEVYSTSSTADNESSILKLNKNDLSFELKLNMCSGMLNITGSYTYNDADLILENLKYSPYDGVIMPNQICFNKMSYEKLQLIDSIGCVSEDNVFTLE